LYEDFQAQVFYSLSLLLHLNVQPIVITLTAAQSTVHNPAGHIAASFSAFNSCSIFVLCFVPRRNITQVADRQIRTLADV
jgi:uncharacterized membrane protein